MQKCHCLTVFFRMLLMHASVCWRISAKWRSLPSSGLRVRCSSRRCPRFAAALSKHRHIRRLPWIAVPVVACCATQLKRGFCCYPVVTYVCVANVFRHGASRDDAPCVTQTSANGYGLRSMNLGQADPVYLESLCPETYVKYSGAALVVVASAARVSLHSKRFLDAVVARWERTFGQILPLCVVLHSVANQQTSG